MSKSFNGHNANVIACVAGFAHEPAAEIKPVAPAGNLTLEDLLNEIAADNEPAIAAANIADNETLSDVEIALSVLSC